MLLKCCKIFYLTFFVFFLIFPINFIYCINFFFFITLFSKFLIIYFMLTFKCASVSLFGLNFSNILKEKSKLKYFSTWNPMFTHVFIYIFS